MELSKLKTFAQNARTDLLRQIRSNLDIATAEESLMSRSHPQIHQRLMADIHSQGLGKVTERIAYCWFNRFCALRFMDLNGCNPVMTVSARNGTSTTPEILDRFRKGEADSMIFSETARQEISALLQDTGRTGDNSTEAYRRILIAVCSHWHRTMPFMFQDDDDYSQFMLPRDLLSTDSILQKIRDAMTPENCQSVEILGWLYQFYISEKKDQIFDDLKKKNIKVSPENIPAATQLFTPEWIVRYLVENSLGRLWLQNNPGSDLAEAMNYYVGSTADEAGTGPEEGQTPADNSGKGSGSDSSVSNGEKENPFPKIGSPEEIRICDPCCGSGHMLVYAFDILSRIYEESAYDREEYPELILRHNLVGLELDDRAAELASFALIMKAYAKDRKIFTRKVMPEIYALNSITLTDSEISSLKKEAGGDIITPDVEATLCQFADADNLGSLITPPISQKKAEDSAQKLQERNFSAGVASVAVNATEILKTATRLCSKYHVVVTNPPYMSSQHMNGQLAAFLKRNYKDSRTDLYAAFMERNFGLCYQSGYISMITMQSWMFLSTFEKLREKIISQKTLTTMAQLGAKAFDSFGGEIVSTTAFIINNIHNKSINGSYIKLTDVFGEKDKEDVFHERKANPFITSSGKFTEIPGSPIAYWLNDRFLNVFKKCKRLEDNYRPVSGITTADNDRFLRRWYEVSLKDIGLDMCDSIDALESHRKWFPYNKGGDYRRWYGNRDFVINWQNDGNEIKNFKDKYGKPKSSVRNPSFYFSPSITWSFISSSYFASRYSPVGSIFDVAGSSVFPEGSKIPFILAMMNCNVTSSILSVFNPTLNFQVGNIANLPLPSATFDQEFEIKEIAQELIKYAQHDWDEYETSWNFTVNPLLDYGLDRYSLPLKDTCSMLMDSYRRVSSKVQELEEQNNRKFIDLYDLEGELTPDFPLEEVTLFCNSANLYPDKSQEERDILQRASIIRDLVSFAVGCMFGRYSLDYEGLVLADQGDTLDKYHQLINEPTFEPDEDNIIPVLEDSRFPDDICERFREFVKAAFGADNLAANMDFIQNALNVSNKPGYTIRDYFTGEFYQDHLKRYRKRPIYWMIRSPKGHFKALFYLHRYQPHLVGRLRSEYTLPYCKKLEEEKENLQAQIISAKSDKASKAEKGKTASMTRRCMQIDKILSDMKNFDSKFLYPLSQDNVELDLDDGVKVNYGKLPGILEKIPGFE